MTEFAFFYCQHQAERMNRVLKDWEGPKGCRIRKAALPCSGKLEVVFLLKALENGAAGVALFACPEEECNYLVGSSRSGNRLRYARKILGDVGLPEDRIRRFVFERPPKSVDLEGLSAWMEGVCAGVDQQKDHAPKKGLECLKNST
jgi:coenzyme F420-reducing hydrogenase delta subunit